MRNKPTAWAETVQRMCLRGIAKTISKNYPQNHYRSQYGILHILTWKGHETEADGALWRLKSFTLMPIIIYPKSNISHRYLISNLLKHLGYLLHLVVQGQTADRSSSGRVSRLHQRSKLDSGQENTYFSNTDPFDLIFWLLQTLNGISALSSSCPIRSLYFIQNEFLKVSSKTFSWKLL